MPCLGAKSYVLPMLASTYAADPTDQASAVFPSAPLPAPSAAPLSVRLHEKLRRKVKKKKSKVAPNPRTVPQSQKERRKEKQEPKAKRPPILEEKVPLPITCLSLPPATQVYTPMMPSVCLAYWRPYIRVYTYTYTGIINAPQVRCVSRECTAMVREAGRKNDREQTTVLPF